MVKEETLFLTMVRAQTGKYQLIQLTAAPDLVKYMKMVS